MSGDCLPNIEMTATDHDKSVNKSRTVVSPPRDNNRENVINTETVELVQKPAFVTTPGHKAARTRALRTFQGYSHEEAAALFPANSFVRLRIPAERLERSGIPTMKTRWEEQTSEQKAREVQETRFEDRSQFDNSEQPSTNRKNNVGLLNRSMISGEVEEICHKEVGHVTEDLSIADGGMVGMSGPPANQDREPRHQEQARRIGSKDNDRATANFALGSHAPINQQTDPQTHPTSRGNNSESAREISITHNTPEKIHSHTAVGHSHSFGNSRLANRSEGSAFKSPAETKIHSSPRLPQNSVVLSAGTAPIPQQSSILTNSGQSSLALRSIDIQPAKRVRIDPSSTSSTPVVGQQGLQTRSKTANAATSPSSINNESTATEPQIRSERATRSSARSQPAIDQNRSVPSYDMAPVRDPNSVDASLKDAIQKLYEVQSQVHGFVPETQPLLIDKMTELAASLAHLQTLTSPTLSPNNPIHQNRIAPEVIDYVDDSRNPDIYNREFVELVQRGNAVMNGKRQAFRDFSETFAKTLKEGMPELSSEVDRIMANAGFRTDSSSSSKPKDAGANGTGGAERRADVRKDGETSANGSRGN